MAGPKLEAKRQHRFAHDMNHYLPGLLCAGLAFATTSRALGQTSLPAETQPPVPEAKANSATTGVVSLSSLDVSRALQMWVRPRANASVTNKPLRVGGQSFATGFGTHALSRLFIRLGGNASRFTAVVGVDDAAGKGSVAFKIIGDDKPLWESGVVRGG